MLRQPLAIGSTEDYESAANAHERAGLHQVGTMLTDEILGGAWVVRKVAGWPTVDGPRFTRACRPVRGALFGCHVRMPPVGWCNWRQLKGKPGQKGGCIVGSNCLTLENKGFARRRPGARNAVGGTN
jgi:hypothetical protein